jgi:hypothetical protein
MQRTRRRSQASDPIETAADRNSEVSREPSGSGSGGPETGSGVAGDATDSIALRAYRRYEERGREHGRDLDDWVEAERELANKDPE